MRVKMSVQLNRNVAKSTDILTPLQRAMNQVRNGERARTCGGWYGRADLTPIRNGEIYWLTKIECVLVSADFIYCLTPSSLFPGLQGNPH